MDTGQKERMRQAIVIMRKLTQDLGLPYEDEEVRAIKDCLTDLVRQGTPWEGQYPLSKWGRIAHIQLQKSGTIELTLRAAVHNATRNRH